MKKLPGIRKIAVLRANALGDFIFVLPALRALRETYPNAEIVFLGRVWHEDFVPDRVDMIDRVIVVPPCRGVGEAEDYKNNEPELERFFQAMQRENFDLALQLHGGGRFSNPFVSQLGAKLTLGLQSDDAPPLDINIPYIYYQNEILRFLEVVSYVGASTAKISPEINMTAADMREAGSITGKLRYIVLHPGASDTRRRWPTERFAAVAEHFLNEGYQMYVTGVKDEAGLAEDIEKNTGGRAVNLAGKLSLGGLAALLQQAALVVLNDTGPLHLAEAVGAKTVGIYWCGNVINAGPMTRARHRPLLSWMLECAECAKKRADGTLTGDFVCPHRSSFVTDVTAEECLAACKSLLAT